MTGEVDIQYLIKLVEKQYPDRDDLIHALQNCKGGQWTSKRYYQIVDSRNANQPGAEWQHEDCVVLEQEDRGDIVIDLLKDGRVGGIEFFDLHEQ